MDRLFDHMPVDSIDAIDTLLLHADRTLVHGRRDAAVINIAIVRVLRNSPYGLAYIESRYRRWHSDTFLIAVPTRMMPKGFVCRRMPGLTEAPYYLWVGVNGQVEANDELARCGSTAAENLVRLHETGFLCVD